MARRALGGFAGSRRNEIDSLYRTGCQGSHSCDWFLHGAGDFREHAWMVGIKTLAGSKIGREYLGRDDRADRGQHVRWKASCPGRGAGELDPVRAWEFVKNRARTESDGVDSARRESSE